MAVSARFVRIPDALPVIAVVVAAGMLLLPGTPEEPQEAILKVLAVATTVLLVLRQTLIHRERGAVLAEIRDAHAETELALQDNRRLTAELQAQLGEMASVQRQLIHASRQSAVGQLASAIAHEVNNPLTGVLGYADLLLDDLPEDGRGREELETIRSEALRARQIVRALVDFARPHDPEKSPTDLDALVAQTVELVRYHAERGGVSIETTAGAPPTLAVDRASVSQVLVNLITNALQAMPAGGRLRIATATDGRDAVITVADDGIGMDEATVARVFEPFFTTRALDNGHGLGLPVSLGIVEAHDGSMSVSSRPGEGTVVEVRLPLGGPTESRTVDGGSTSGPGGVRP